MLDYPMEWNTLTTQSRTHHHLGVLDKSLIHLTSSSNACTHPMAKWGTMVTSRILPLRWVHSGVLTIGVTTRSSTHSLMGICSRYPPCTIRELQRVRSHPWCITLKRKTEADVNLLPKCSTSRTNPNPTVSIKLITLLKSVRRSRISSTGQWSRAPTRVSSKSKGRNSNKKGELSRFKWM